ncbi:MAG TPA: SpoIIE family protein phosphatase, partial [Thermoanaerobaculia bacterium]|nr:SpoIIE family protein phosphatase [Thermoanaerobaculia bacterium]
PGLVGLLLVAALLGGIAGVEEVTALALLAVGVLVGGWLVVRLLRVLLWRVGRKLAFSYFLIGVLPIPMVLLLVGIALYLLSGALVGHLFRDTLLSFHRELEETAHALLLRYQRPGSQDVRVDGDLGVAFYRQGRRVGGDLEEAPEEWPGWLLGPDEGDAGIARQVPFVLTADGPRMAAALESGDTAILAVFQGDLERQLRERSGIWVEIEPWNADGKRVDLVVGNRQLTLYRSGSERQVTLRREFFGETGGLPMPERPVLFWTELLGRAHSLTSPETVVRLGAFLNSTPRIVQRQVVSSTAEIDTAAWGVLVAIAFLFFDIYAVAVLMALFMIYGLSRAVNRLHRATTAVRSGDFSVRIPVRRRDQLGELQRSFNHMAADLEQLIAAAAQKESLEKELQVARELQQNLLPSSLTTTEAVELASYFEPSAAIGGDYFDLLKLDDGRMAVVVADVSGHGLSAGLRMAMLKAALTMLVDQQLPAQEIFGRLDRLVRSEDSPGVGRPMVTATLAFFDPRTGRLELTNAGHVPTYRVRGEGVEEILLPSPPLGALGVNYASCALQVAPGELVVWLSDGLVEATNPKGEPFGYEGVERSLAGGLGTASEVRDRLLRDVAVHCEGQPPADDRTLVVLRYLPAAAA